MVCIITTCYSERAKRQQQEMWAHVCLQMLLLCLALQCESRLRRLLAVATNMMRQPLKLLSTTHIKCLAEQDRQVGRQQILCQSHLVDWIEAQIATRQMPTSTKSWVALLLCTAWAMTVGLVSHMCFKVTNL